MYRKYILLKWSFNAIKHNTKWLFANFSLTNFKFLCSDSIIRFGIMFNDLVK